MAAYEVTVTQIDSNTAGASGTFPAGQQAMTAINIGTATGTFNGQDLIAGESISYPNIPGKTYEAMPWTAPAGARIQITGFK